MHIDYSIEYLADHLGLVPTVAQWYQDTWGHFNKHLTYEDRVERVTRHSNRGIIPTVFVVLHQQRPVGCASLVENDLSSRPNLSPWLASVYVEPDMRKQGIGSALVQQVESAARTLGIARLYLYTADQDKLYASLGWYEIERCQHHGKSVAVMARDLSPHSEGANSDAV